MPDTERQAELEALRKQIDILLRKCDLVLVGYGLSENEKLLAQQIKMLSYIVDDLIKGEMSK